MFGSQKSPILQDLAKPSKQWAHILGVKDTMTSSDGTWLLPSSNPLEFPHES